ncbi:DHS-like NAD/FAD-binding domain-containing protein, partial [Diaporthe sp. PMI_573]
QKKNIVVIVGAGISVSAGIPDFRSKDGIFKTTANGKQLFDASVYNHNASTEAFHEMIQNLVPLCETASHTPFHHMVATIAYEGRLRRLYTQNIDGLEVSLQPLATHIPLPEKEPWPVTIQLHGGLDKMECHKCHHVSKLDSSLFKGPEPPLCEVCEETDSTRAANGQRRHGVGRLRPRITLYNEPSQDADAIGSVCQADVDDPPDVVIVVGTSLAIPDIQRLVTRLCHAARAKGDGATAWLNLEHEHPSTKHLWDFVIRGTSDKLAALLDLPRW